MAASPSKDRGGMDARGPMPAQRARRKAGRGGLARRASGMDADDTMDEPWMATRL